MESIAPSNANGAICSGWEAMKPDFQWPSWETITPVVDGAAGVSFSCTQLNKHKSKEENIIYIMPSAKVYQSLPKSKNRMDRASLPVDFQK
ncbi:MAG: hypothetical protein H7843_01880 [Nitrospirota bacterium]